MHYWYVDGGRGEESEAILFQADVWLGFLYLSVFRIQNPANKMLILSMISSLFLEMSAGMKTGHLQEATQFTRSLRFSSRPAPHGCWVTVNRERSQQHYMLIKIIPASFYTCTCTHDTRTHLHKGSRSLWCCHRCNKHPFISRWQNVKTDSGAGRWKGQWTCFEWV